MPDGLSYILAQLGHQVTLLRSVLPGDSSDHLVLQYAYEQEFVLLTCNRDDFLQLAQTMPHHGIIIVIRRRTRAEERASLFRLLELAGQPGIQNNITFA